MKPITQVIKEFKDTIEILHASNDPEALNAISELARDIYNPDVRLTDWVQELEAYDSKKTSPNKTEQMRAGNLLEGIALASLYGIQGVSSLKSYRLIIPHCSMSPKLLKLLKRGHENASPGTRANPLLASICA